MTPDERKKLIKIAGLLASPNDGERAVAASLATDILERHGITWEDVLSLLPVKLQVETEDVTAEMLFDEDELVDLQSVMAGGASFKEAVS